MAPIPLKAVVSVSSEDLLHPGTSLLCRGSGKKWLCSPDGKSRRMTEVVIELSKRAKIATIDIGNCSSAFIEVLVGNSDSHDFITLLPQSMLMTVSESKTSRNRTKTVTYRKDKLSTTALSQKWNRIKVICRQPFNLKEQFGLHFISLYSEGNEPSTPTPHLLSPPHTPRLLSQPTSTLPSHTPSRNHFSSTNSENVTPETTERRTPSKLPSLSAGYGKSNFKSPLSSSGIARSDSKTPKRPLRELGNRESNKEGNEFEFSGVEKQSRLFQNAMRGNPSGITSSETNPILEKIIAERNKFRAKKESNSVPEIYQRKKLLHKELPKAEGNRDFAASYEKGAVNFRDTAGAVERMSAFDNEYEIGHEPEWPWVWKKGGGGGRRRKRSRSGGCGKWLSKQKRLDEMISECKEIINKATTTEEEEKCPLEESGSSTTDTPAALDKGATDLCECGSDSDSDATVIEDGDETLSTTEPPLHFVECPICGGVFPGYAIEVHASSCGEVQVPVVID